ncbi:MAG: response regulator transcription factor [Opitutae bacterium]|nr:response regulator transcription factor [Opitutae bacterium]
MKILALEDQPVPGLLLMATLRALGQEADLAADGATAWEKFCAGGYRVVVSDWRMPGLDGLELCRKIRRRGGDYVYFILISSQRVTKASRQEALDAGVDDYLEKPVDPEALGMRLHVAERVIGLTTQVKQLESFIPICSHCKKIRADPHYWQQVEAYLSERQGLTFSHGICPECYEREILPQLRAMGIESPPPPAGAE